MQPHPARYGESNPMEITEVAESPLPKLHAVAAGQAATRAGEYLAFRLGGEEYGIEILRVQEIRSYEAPTGIAGAPAALKGVVNLRGTIVPIVDLRVALSLPEVRYDGSTVVIVLDVGGRVVGLVVDSVSDVTELRAAQVRPAPEFHGAFDPTHIVGLGCIEHDGRERLLILIDIERLMAGTETGLAAVSLQ